MKSLKVNDLFCGPGGLGLGFKQAGFEIVGAWDIDKHAIKLYNHNIGNHAIQADIRQMKWNNLPQADVWTFGFPCQNLSWAGKQAGMMVMCQDCREKFNRLEHNKCPKCGSNNYESANLSGLFFEVMRLLEETRDNDPNRLPLVILAENVKALKPYLPVLQEEYEARGYRMYYTIYNSKFWGVPQNRERYFVVGVRNDIEKEFVFPEQQEHHVPKLSSFLDKEVDKKYYVDDEKARIIIEQAAKRVELVDIHPCLTPHRVSKRQNGRRAKENEREMFTLTKQDIHGVIHKQGSGFAVRRLTPREFARLQGFPDDYEIVVSESQAYIQFGKAVTVNISRAIAEQIKMFLLSVTMQNPSESPRL